MRRTFTILFLLVVLALPVAQAGAAAKTTKRVVTKKFTGVAYQADRWGDLQVRITVRKTTVGKKVTRKMTAVSVPVYPDHTDRSVYINEQALPLLKGEALRAQSTRIDLVGRDSHELRVRRVAAVRDPEGEEGMTRVEHVMGMPIVVDLRDEDADEETLDYVFGWFRWVDATFSTYKEDSEISRLARGELEVGDASPELRWVLNRCEELRRETHGYFDARAAGALDPSGLVKGWSVDRAAALLRDAGMRNFAVNAGGDMCLSGRAIPQLTWRVGIQHPGERMQVAAVVEANDLAIATSGAYARGAHITDPHMGRAPDGVLSVTVVGRDLATADAYATAAYAMGPVLGPEWTARLRGYEAMTILADETVLTTGRFPAV